MTKLHIILIVLILIIGGYGLVHKLGILSPGPKAQQNIAQDISADKERVPLKERIVKVPRDITFPHEREVYTRLYLTLDDHPEYWRSDEETLFTYLHNDLGGDLGLIEKMYRSMMENDSVMRQRQQHERERVHADEITARIRKVVGLCEVRTVVVDHTNQVVRIVLAGKQGMPLGDVIDSLESAVCMSIKEIFTVYPDIFVVQAEFFYAYQENAEKSVGKITARREVYDAINYETLSAHEIIKRFELMGYTLPDIGLEEADKL